MEDPRTQCVRLCCPGITLLPGSLRSLASILLFLGLPATREIPHRPASRQTPLFCACPPAGPPPVLILRSYNGRPRARGASSGPIRMVLSGQGGLLWSLEAVMPCTANQYGAPTRRCNLGALGPRTLRILPREAQALWTRVVCMAVRGAAYILLVSWSVPLPPGLPTSPWFAHRLCLLLRRACLPTTLFLSRTG